MTLLIAFWLIAIFIGLPALILFAVVKMATGIARDCSDGRPRKRGPMCQYCGVQYPHHTNYCPRYRTYKMDVNSAYPQNWQTPKDPD